MYILRFPDTVRKAYFPASPPPCLSPERPSLPGPLSSPSTCRIAARCLLTGALACLLLAPTMMAAMTLAELEQNPKMTPKRFANLFEDFDYEFFNYVQRPETFLGTRKGDCDDYALLADRVLGQRGYTTRIVRVVLAGRRINHVVCYVEENKAYLDFNSRKYFLNLDRSGPTAREIADKVAASFEANWSSASVFTYAYDDDKKVIRYTVVKTDPPSRDPDRQSAGTGQN